MALVSSKTTSTVSFPYPSTLNISNFVSLKLTQNNYMLWKTQISGLIESQDMGGFLDGTYPEPAEFVLKSTVEAEASTTKQEYVMNYDYIMWRRSDRLLRGWIVGTLSEEVLGLAVGIETSAAVWKALSEYFARNTKDREFFLMQKMHLHSKQNYKTINDYIRGFKEICDELDAIGKSMEDQQKVFGLLKGLGKGYRSFVTSMMKPPIPSYNDVIQLLQSHENMKSFHCSASATDEHSAFFAQNKNNGKHFRNNRQGQVPFNMQGQNPLNRQGQNSFNSKGRGFPQAVQKPSEAPQRNNQNPSQNEQDKDDLICQICLKPRHSAFECWHRFKQGYQPNNAAQALAAMAISENETDAWFPDTGATQHMTSDNGKLIHCQPYHGSDKIMVGNGHKLKITHIGDTVLHTDKNSVKLKNVLVVPEIKKNLLSVSQLTTDFPYMFEFTANNFVIKNRETGKVITTGTRNGGLYSLEPNQNMTFYSSRFQATSDTTWHQRLGHPHMKIISYLKHNKLISVNEHDRENFLCESCQLGKSCRLPFLNIDEHCSEPFGKIHCDLWGPAPVKSFQNFKFYVIFVDEFTRFTWFFPLRKKSNFFHCFISFHKFLKNQFEKNIKVFQSDGGGEFGSKEFQEYLLNHGIKSQKSCPGTPQQNGVAERKHKNITELGLTMLFHAGVPKRFWVEAFSTATWLINRLPSAILAMKSPIEKLTGKKPDYSSLRVFGSRCFPCLRRITQNKFDPKSLPCVFLGYSEFYKGYRCFHPPTGKVYLSRDVVFDEKTFPFMKPGILYSSCGEHTNLTSFNEWIAGTFTTAGIGNNYN